MAHVSEIGAKSTPVIWLRFLAPIFRFIMRLEESFWRWKKHGWKRRGWWITLPYNKTFCISGKVDNKQQLIINYFSHVDAFSGLD